MRGRARPTDAYPIGAGAAGAWMARSAPPGTGTVGLVLVPGTALSIARTGRGPRIDAANAPAGSILVSRISPKLMARMRDTGARSGVPTQPSSRPSGPPPAGHCRLALLGDDGGDAAGRVGTLTIRTLVSGQAWPDARSRSAVTWRTDTARPEAATGWGVRLGLHGAGSAWSPRLGIRSSSATSDRAPFTSGGWTSRTRPVGGDVRTVVLSHDALGRLRRLCDHQLSAVRAECSCREHDPDRAPHGPIRCCLQAAPIIRRAPT